MDVSANSTTNITNNKTTPTILIVEDDQSLSNLYDEKFKKEGFNTLVARNGADGLNMAITKSPDFILVDMIMPKMTGMELMEKLISSPGGNKIPVVFLTNVAQAEERAKALELGARDYLAKAMHSPEDIVQIVKKHLGVFAS